MAVIEALSEDEMYLWSILSDPSGLDQAEMLWYDAEQEDGCFRAWAFQWGWWRSDNPQQIDQCARALSLDTPIPTPSGWSAMGSLQVGDQVFDADGVPTLVTAISPTWNDRDCYEVCFDDHTTIVADGEHLWETWDKKARAAKNPNRRGIAKPRVRTTLEILDTLMYGSEKNHAVDVSGALQADTAELPLDPYYLGFWLGDGSSRTSEITTDDRWVLEELVRRGFVIAERANPLLYGVGFPGAHNHKTQSVQAELRRLGVLNNKHVPSLYLRASETQRRDLLSGLVDSDGYIQDNGSCEVTQKREVIALGLVELLRSLGEKPRISKKTAMMSGVDCGPVYRVTWRPRSNPARLPRKAERFYPGSRLGALGQRRIIDVRKVPSRPVRCITVESPRHLFLAGEGMIPTHNSVGKSLSIQVRAFAFPFVHPQAEMVITAPEGVHLDAITDNVETKFLSTRLGKHMLVKGRSSIKHKPFHMNFANGARIMGRIPQRDGKGVKGIHPIWLEMDEAQDYPDRGWIEINETLKRGSEGAVWRAHGVTRGVRDYFYKYTQPESSWRVHRYTAMHRPTWTDEEREAAIENYTSRDNADYKRNVLGQHGDATNPLFVLHRLMKCVDAEQEDSYNSGVYQSFNVSDEYLQDRGGDIVPLLDFSPEHKKWPKIWAGMDVGYTNHPSEILIFGEASATQTNKLLKLVKTKRAIPGDHSVMTLLARIHLARISHGQQVAAILHVVNWYKVQGFSMDKTGLGLPLFQDIQERAPKVAHTIKGYNFSSKILVDFDQTIELDEFRGDPVKEAGIEKRVLEYSSDTLRDWVDSQRVWLPWDRELIGEFQGQTYKVIRDTMNQYGKKEYSQGKFHALDAARMAFLGMAQSPIEELTREDKFVPAPTLFLG